jgi:hypothetical protein
MVRAKPRTRTGRRRAQFGERAIGADIEAMPAAIHSCRSATDYCPVPGNRSPAANGTRPVSEVR